MARKVDETTNISFVQLTEQEPGLYNKSRPDYVRREKVYLAWEGTSCEMKDLVRTYFLIKSYNKVTIENMLIKALNNTSWSSLPTS
jgi:hypothetical protein